MATRQRKRAQTPERRTIRTSISLDVLMHAKLNALASLRGVPMTTLISEVLADSLKGFVIMDRRDSSNQLDPDSDVGSADAA